MPWVILAIQVAGQIAAILNHPTTSDATKSSAVNLLQTILSDISAVAGTIGSDVAGLFPGPVAGVPAVSPDPAKQAEIDAANAANVASFATGHPRLITAR
jgi:hypothetical protein